MPDYTVKADVDTMLRANDKAAIRSAIGVGTTDAPTFLAQTLTGQSLTGTQATSLVNMATTWNTSGTPTAIKLNVIETGVGSNAASNLIDLQVGGASKFNVEKTGNINIDPTNVAAVLTLKVGANAAFEYYGGSGWGDQSFSIKARGGLKIDSSTGQHQLVFATDTILTRDAAGILAQRNGTAKQTLRIYNTYTSASIYERAVMDWNGPTPGNLQIGTEFLGSGSGMAARPIDFVTGGVVRMSIAAGGTVTIDSISITRGTGTNSTSLSVGSALSSNTTGVGNSGIGYNSLNSNTTGSFNVALGNNALQNNSTGGSNAAIGIYALNANSTGGNNMAIGGAALQANTTGSYNVAIGSLAGFYIADGATGNATGSNSLFLGSNTKALGAAQTNQTVIGYNATGSGSNSTTLNNTSATLTKINGTSAHVLDVTGTIKLSPPASVTPANNGELMVEATSNTTLTFKFKGSDGTVRSGTVILA